MLLIDSVKIRACLIDPGENFDGHPWEEARAMWKGGRMRTDMGHYRRVGWGWGNGLMSHWGEGVGEIDI